MTLETRPLFFIEVDVAAPVDIGETGAGRRRAIPITGGSFSGVASGRVLPGADWQTILQDGTIELSAHYALETDAGERIEVTSEGLRAGRPEVLGQLARGEAVDPADYYFRTAVRFRTGAPALAWLNTILAVSTARREAARVTLTVYEVL
ncbi:MAG TPA: DUF3237 domain-containing protein [Caulobacteraceae bacterium]|jgi:hypothetical protein